MTPCFFLPRLICIQRAPPPDAEWWDAALLPNKTYDDLSLGLSKLKIHNDDSPITIYIQHPIPIPAPGDKNKIELKPLMLTKKVTLDDFIIWSIDLIRHSFL